MAGGGWTVVLSSWEIRVVEGGTNLSSPSSPQPLDPGGAEAAQLCRRLRLPRKCSPPPRPQHVPRGPRTSSDASIALWFVCWRTAGGARVWGRGVWACTLAVPLPTCPAAHTIKAAAAPRGTPRRGATRPWGNCREQGGCVWLSQYHQGPEQRARTERPGRPWKQPRPPLTLMHAARGPAHCQDKPGARSTPRSSNTAEPSPRSEEIWRLAQGTEQNSSPDGAHGTPTPPTPLLGASSGPLGGRCCQPPFPMRTPRPRWRCAYLVLEQDRQNRDLALGYQLPGPGWLSPGGRGTSFLPGPVAILSEARTSPQRSSFMTPRATRLPQGEGRPRPAMGVAPGSP